MDNSDGTALVRQRVNELGEKFLRRTQSEAAVLRVLIDRLREGDSNVLPEVARMAHKIHGSGAMFGFPAISESAAEIEHLCGNLMMTQTTGEGLIEQTIQRLMECIAQLARAAEAPGEASVGSSPPG